MNKQFTKSDLKDGMVLVTRKHKGLTFIEGGLYARACEDFNFILNIGLFKDDLTNISNLKEIDIIKVLYMGETLWERTREFKAGDKVKHFKGEIYEILNFAKHTETGEEMVVYQAIYGDNGIYVRSKDMFMSGVDHKKYPDVKQKYRMELLEEKR